MGAQRNKEVSSIGDLVGVVVQALEPVCERYDSVAEAWEQLLPDNLRRHCRLGSVRGGSLKILADGSSYLCELQWCSEDLLREVQRLCPAARVRRIEVAMAR